MPLWARGRWLVLAALTAWAVAWLVQSGPGPAIDVSTERLQSTPGPPINHVLVLGWHGDTPITVGDDDATFPLPAEVSAPFTLATREGGRWVLRAPAGAELRAARDGVPVLDHEGPLALDPGTTVELRVGDFRFFLRPTEKPAETPRAGLGLDRRLLRLARCLLRCRWPADRRPRPTTRTASSSIPQAGLVSSRPAPTHWRPQRTGST